MVVALCGIGGVPMSEQASSFALVFVMSDCIRVDGLPMSKESISVLA